MKTAIHNEVVKEIVKEIKISPTGRRLIILAILIQLPFCWLPFATQIITAILLAIALTHMEVIKKVK